MAKTVSESFNYTHFDVEEKRKVIGSDAQGREISIETSRSIFPKLVLLQQKESNSSLGDRVSEFSSSGETSAKSGLFSDVSSQESPPKAGLFRREPLNPHMGLKLKKPSVEASLSDPQIEHTQVTDDNLGLHLEKSLPNIKWGPKLGEGAFGSVHVMHSEIFEKPVALKKVKLSTAPIIGKDLEEQGEVLGLLLGSKHLTRAKGFATLDPDGHLHFHLIDSNFSIKNLEGLVGHRIVAVAYKYFDGAKNVADMISSGEITPKLAKQIGRQVIEGIETLHHNRLIHRDLKPDNTLLTDEGVKLIDWNTVVFPTTEDQKVNAIAGTPGYSAPEIFKGSYGKEVDLYSYGVFLYELHYGKFEDKNAGDKIFDPKKWHQDFVHSLESKGEHLDPKEKKRLDDLLRRLMHPNPKFRLPLDLVKTHPYFTGKNRKAWHKSLQEWRVTRKELSLQKKESREIELL